MMSMHDRLMLNEDGCIVVVLPLQDVKPDNIILEGGQWGGRVFLVDFGGVQVRVRVAVWSCAARAPPHVLVGRGPGPAGFIGV